EELDVLQVKTLPVFVSFSVVTPALAVIAPPGWIVKVIATARATPALTPTATAVAAPVNRTLRVSLLRKAIRPSLLDRSTCPRPAIRPPIVDPGLPTGYRRVRYRHVTLRARGQAWTNPGDAPSATHVARAAI